MTKEKKYIGVWMDHSKAMLMEPKSGEFITHHVDLHFSSEDREHVVAKSEHILHNKEQQKQAAYYKQIMSGIKNYDGVLLFGPTQAKKELHNLLKADREFDHVVVDVEDADKMTENQQHAFIKKHFRL